MDEIWSIQLLGQFRLQKADRTVSRFRTQKAAGILAYLAYHRHRSHPRETLIGIFWPEAELESARHSLSLALSSFRNQLEPPGVPAGSVLVADRWSVELNPEAFTTDVMEFEQALRRAAQAQDDRQKARHLAEAIERYGGPLLPGFYDEWALAEQLRLAERFVEALRQLVALLSKGGETARAVELARRAVSADPLREELHAELMRLLAATGQPAAALRQYREVERLLDQELGELPGPTLRQLARRIEEQEQRTGGQPPLPAPARPIPPRTTVPLPLPAGTVSFLLTDIEGSTGRWEQEGERFRIALGLYHTILRREIRRHGGHEVREAGDSFVVAFAGAGDALACAVAVQRALEAQAWPEGTAAIPVRMALHSGDMELEAGEYRGPALQRAARILAAAHGGQILCSETTFALLRRDLETEVRLHDLGVYRLRDAEVPERLYQVEDAGMRGREFPPLRADRAHGGNLPLQATRFFGREGEIEKLVGWLAPQTGLEGSQVRRLERSERSEPSNLPTFQPANGCHRLVTLTGPGGTGKTRLAIEAARHLVEAYSGAVWFVSLAEITDARLVPEVILGALPVDPAPDRPPLPRLVEALRRQPSLVILDNFEHLLVDRSEEWGGGETVQALLEQVPGLAVLVTSRQLLGLPGEREFSVPALRTPGAPEAGREGRRRTPGAPARPPAMAGALEGLTMYDSVRLFVDRAQAVQPYFQVTSGNAPAVAELCCRLEGIPLAIELAAGRAQVLTPAQMLQQLASSPAGRFNLLVSRKRGVVERQRALRATIDWSYHLLSAPLQRCFARLSVLRGSWSVEAAEAVAEEPLALDHLAQLRECSLMQTEEGPDGVRFRMLETLREYAGAQLSGEDCRAAARRHAEYFLSLAETAEPRLRGEEQAAWLERLEVDQDNLRAACQWALAGTCGAQPGEAGPAGEETRHAGAEMALRFCHALWSFWSIRGHLTEGRRSVAAALAAAPADHPTLGPGSLRARALTAAGALALDQSDYPAARAFLEESVARSRELGDEAGLAHALNCLANVLLDQDDREAALPLYQEALACYRRAGDLRGVSIALSNLGVLHLERGDLDQAAELLEESMDLKRRTGNRSGMANSLESLGNLERSRKNHARALEHCREALAIRRELGHRLGIAMSLNNLGHLLLEGGDTEAARAHLLESLALFEELEQPRGMLENLTGLAGAAAAAGDHERAARLLGAAAAGREARGFAATACEQRVIRRGQAAVEGALGKERCAAEGERGRALSLEDGVAEARR